MPDQHKRILVVDDDPKVRQLLRRCLETDGYLVTEASSRDEVFARLHEQCFDLITLDLNLGHDDGLTIAAELRSTSQVPIFIVTGKGDIIDKVVGLEMGADDYISKPFHVREVLARVKSIIRRSSGQAKKGPHLNAIPTLQPASNGPQYHFEGWRVDPARFELYDPKGEICALTTADFKLLMVLIKNPRRVLSRDQIMTGLNGLSWTPLDRTIDNQIARLRKKIEEDAAHPRLIKTVRGIGYTFVADVQIGEETAPAQGPASS